MDEKCCVQCAKHQPKTEFLGKNGNLTATCAKCREYDSARKREKRAAASKPSPSKDLPLARAFKHPPPSLNHHIGASTRHQGMIVDQQPSSKSSGSFISFRAPDVLAREAPTVSQDAPCPKVALSVLEAQQACIVDHQSKLLVDLVAMDDD